MLGNKKWSSLYASIYESAFDNSVNQTQDNLPAGWNFYCAVTYNEVARKLQCSGFHWLQYSDWACDPIDAGDAYWMMLFLLRICPPSKFQSTVKAIKIHHIANWAFDVTHDIQLGGEYSPHLKGPTPAGLVPANIPAFVPLTLQQLPQFTQESQEVMDINNWRI
ncbi:hypothetical protein V8B97DRAFT_2024140 [Scleroderma yunnanense]